MAENENKHVLLSLKNVSVKFNVRGRILTAIRNVSLDIYEHESIAIVGESGSGKSVLTKTFAGMLETNGFISDGSIVFSDDELSVTTVPLSRDNLVKVDFVLKRLNKYSAYERGAAEFRAIVAKRDEIRRAQSLSAEEQEASDKKLKELSDRLVELQNSRLTLDKRFEQDLAEIKKDDRQIRELRNALATEKMRLKNLNRFRKMQYNNSAIQKKKDAKEIADLKKLRDFHAVYPQEKTENPYDLPDEIIERNRILAYEVLLSIGRYPLKDQVKLIYQLLKVFKNAIYMGEDLSDREVRNRIFQTAVLYVEYRKLHEDTQILEGWAVIDCAKVRYTNDWQQIRGRRIATVFQDPMTSLNPIVTIGKQIMTVILKHQHCTQEEAKQRTLEIMGKVGIPEPEKRFDDYPFQYSGGMRQRIVIAIALSCQPKILICDEPTTALDVTIQAQIIRLIKDLQKELGFTTVYITHDLGVVANVAERVAVLYAGQIVEIGTVEDIFYEPKHPYTWALLNSLPQLTDKNRELFSIAGTPPSLYNKIVGDAFAPRNQYAMQIDLEQEPPMFKVSDTHWAKTWLLDPRAPKVEMPENIRNLHEKMVRFYGDAEE